MRDAKGFVQIEVAHVAAKFTRCCGADQCVHVGTINVHAPAVAVDQGAQLFDVGFKHAVGRWISNHHRRQVGAVLFALFRQVHHINIAFGVASGHHDRQARHLGAGRVGAVGRCRYQANVSVALTLRVMKRFDDQHARVLTLRAGVGLQADACVARGLAQPAAQLLVQLGIAKLLVSRRKRVDVGKLWPGDGNHLAGRIQLHGARAERDHAAVQRQILVAQAADVAQHGRF